MTYTASSPQPVDGQDLWQIVVTTPGEPGFTYQYKGDAASGAAYIDQVVERLNQQEQQAMAYFVFSEQQLDEALRTYAWEAAKSDTDAAAAIEFVKLFLYSDHALDTGLRKEIPGTGPN